MTVIFLAAAILVPILYLRQHRRSVVPVREPREIPRDLRPLREPFLEAIESIQKGDGAAAESALTRFTFGQRSVEEYRLYYLANAQQLQGHVNDARITLASLWKKEPKLIYWQDVGFTLATIYSEEGNYAAAARVYSAIADRADVPAVAAAARSQSMTMQLYSGDPAAALYDARRVLVEGPKSAQARPAVAVAQSLTSAGPATTVILTTPEKLARAKSLVQTGDSDEAVSVLDSIRPVSSSQADEVSLQKGIALSRLHKYEESNRVLEPLTSRFYKTAIPALATLSENYRSLFTSIDPVRYKTTTSRVRTGTRKVRKGKKTVRQAVYRTVKKQEKLIDLAAQAKKDEFERLRSERLKDILILPAGSDIRMRALKNLYEIAESKNQDDSMRDLVREMVKLDKFDDTGLQRSWAAGWAAYLRGDYDTSKQLLGFIHETYANPTARRQSRYWYARSIEQQGQKSEAAKIFQEISEAPYEDLYALFARKRGARGPLVPRRHVWTKTWEQIARTDLPKELRMGYELNELGLLREARLEVQRNMNEKNSRYAKAILGDLYLAAGSVAAYEFLRQGFPQLATADQDDVPRYFIDLYYPLHYEETIRLNASKRNVDPFLIMGLIRQESSFDPTVRSRVGATGLMQLMPATAKELGGILHGIFSTSRLTDPEVNIELGTFYVRKLIDRYNGEELLAIAAYNGGQGNVSKWRAANHRPLDEFIEGMPFPETRNYVKRVIIHRSTYKDLDKMLAADSGDRTNGS
ncbi:MAG: lytic transglycosylase domain-containing protein [Acidobacteriota bacterium]